MRGGHETRTSSDVVTAIADNLVRRGVAFWNEGRDKSIIAARYINGMASHARMRWHSAPGNRCFKPTAKPLRILDGYFAFHDVGTCRVPRAIHAPNNYSAFGIAESRN